MKKLFLLLILVLLLASLAGCRGSREPSAFTTATATYPPPITTEPKPPSPTPSPTLPPVTQTPAATLTPTPYTPFIALVAVDNLLLRGGPGMLHPALEMFQSGKGVEVLGRVPGLSWVYVGAGDGLYGYMKIELLDLKGDIYDAPEVIPDGFVIVKGHVYLPDGTPVSRVTLTLTPPDGDVSAQDAATTDRLGQYYFYLPEYSDGMWMLEAGAYSPESNAVDASGNLIAAFPPALQVDVTEADAVWYNLQMVSQ